MIGITGSNGFIGSYFVRELGAKEIDRLRTFTRRAGVLADETCTEGGRLEQIHGDLRSLEDCERFAADVRVIFHFAHCNTPLSSDHDQIEDASLNLIPTLTLLRAIERIGARPHLVYISSGGAVYGANPQRVPFRETDPCNPRCSYGIQKLAVEHYLRLAAISGTLTATVLRVGNAYGTQLPPDRKQGLIGVAIRNLAEGRPVRVFGNPENVRDYVHLRDLLAMALLAATPREPFSIYNVGSGHGYSVVDVLRTIEESHGAPFPISFDETEGSQLTDWAVLDCSKAKRELGWSAAVALQDGIREMLACSRNDEVGHVSAMA